MFSSATVLLFGGIVGALPYLESSAANADKLLEETSLSYEVLWAILYGGCSLVAAEDKSLVLGTRWKADAGNLSISVIS